MYKNLFLLTTLSLSVYAKNNYSIAYVINDNTKVMQNPSLNSKVISTINKNQEIKILYTVYEDYETFWYKTNDGYIKPKNVSNNIKYSNKNKLNVRAKPSTKSKILDTFTLNDAVVILKDLGVKNNFNWVLTTKGYVASQYLMEKEIVRTSVTKKTVKPKVNLKEKKAKQVKSKYRNALKEFKNKNYKKSYAQFEDLFNNELNNVNVNFYLARSAFELKNYQAALVAYERVLFEKPDSIRAKLEVARTYFVKKSYKKSQSMFREIKKEKNTSKNLKVIINRYLKILDNRISKHKTSAVLMLGIAYDSNINNRSSNESFGDVNINGALTPLTNTTDDISAFAHQEMGLVNHTYRYNFDLSIKNSLMIFNKSMFNNAYNDKDVALVSWTPGLNIKYNKDINVDYLLYVDNIFIDKKSSLSTYGIWPKLNYKYDNKNAIASHFKYIKKSFVNSVDKNKNSSYKELAFNLTNSYSVLHTNSYGFTYAKEEESDAQDTNNNSISLLFANKYKHRNNIILSNSISYKNTKYTDTNSNYLVKKDNKLYSYIFNTTYVHTAKEIVQGSFNYSKQESNIPTDDYSKYTLGVNLIRTF